VRCLCVLAYLIYLENVGLALDFYVNLVSSPFGSDLCKYALSKGGDKRTSAMMYRVSAIRPDNWTDTTFVPGRDRLGLAHRLEGHIMWEWAAVLHEVKVEVDALRWYNLWYSGNKREGIFMWDVVWDNFDRHVWEAARKMDRPEDEGRIAREYGLLDPKSVRPTFRATVIMSSIEEQKKRDAVETRAKKTPAPAASTQEAPLLPAVPTTAQSGHSYVEETKDSLPKEKTKTKGVPTNSNVPSDVTASEDFENKTLDDYPDVLPATFKLPRKVLKVSTVRS